MTFWIPEPLSDDQRQWRLNADTRGTVGSTGRKAMMGGVTTGAVLDAMERATGRDVLWMSAHFLSGAPAETDFAISLDILKTGRRITQARGWLGFDDQTVMAVQASLGEADPGPLTQFAAMPNVAAPEECPVKSHTGDVVGENDLFSQFERRIADSDEIKGRERIWFRQVGEPPVSAGLIAILADHLAGAITRTRGSVNLDSSLRMVSRRPSRWILVDSQIEAYGATLYHGQMNLYAEDGTLLALASQSGMLPSR